MHLSGDEVIIWQQGFVKLERNNLDHMGNHAGACYGLGSC